MATKKTLYVVLIKNSHTECCDILGGVFDNKKDMNKFIKENNLENQGYEVEETKINEWNYEFIDDDDVTLEEALKQLNEHGFHIEQIEADKFMCFDNGRFGFCSDESPFIVDGDEIFEIYEQYISE